MNVYHGSSVKGLKQIISEYSDDDNFEGKACYFSDSYQIAKEYAGTGGSVYKAIILAELLDLTTKELLSLFLNQIFIKYGFSVDDFEFLDAGTNHVLKHYGKNGVWCLGLDVVSVLKFEPKFKKREDLQELEKKLEKEIQDKIESYPGFIISDSSNYPSRMIIMKGPIDVVSEFNV